MKKILLLLFVTALFQVNAQISPSNPVTNAFYLDSVLLDGQEVTVPEGKFWTVFYKSDDWLWGLPDEFLTQGYSYSVEYPLQSINGSTILPEGHKLKYNTNSSSPGRIGILEYNFSTGETLSYNDDEPLKDRIKLFPNPTTNQLALNSDKVYHIEVFDLTGNKVMELKGNTINVEHLSSATYIVNAIDLETKESLSYKVVKK